MVGKDKNGERSRTCHGVARRAKTEVFSSRGDSRSSLNTTGFLHIFTKLQRRLTCEEVSFR